MAAAARIHAIEKNKDPRRYTLLAFGGAGPAHAMAVASLLEIDEVIFPAGAGVASALGCLVAPPSISLARTHVGRLDALDWAKVDSIYAGMEHEAIAALLAAGVSRAEITIERSVDLRLAGQYHELTVEDAHTSSGLEREEFLAVAFEHAYAERYGRMLTGLPIEATTWRVEARGPEGRVRLAPQESGDPDPNVALKGQRPVYFAMPDPGHVSTPVYERATSAPGSPVRRSRDH